jgi:hypothetical protein
MFYNKNGIICGCMDASELWFFLSFQGMVDSFGEGEMKALLRFVGQNATGNFEELKF